MAGGRFANKEENTALATMQKLAVKIENVMVARVALHNMQQNKDESVRSFCARLRGQASKYAVTCPDCNKDINYTNQIVRDCVVWDITDDDIRLDVLGSSNKDMDMKKL